MHLSAGQVEASKQETGYFSGACAGVRLSGSRVYDDQRGFTLIELVMVMVVVGILAVFVAPRFFDANIFTQQSVIKTTVVG